MQIKNSQVSHVQSCLLNFRRSKCESSASMDRITKHTWLSFVCGSAALLLLSSFVGKKHLISLRVICPDANSSGCPISQDHLSGTSVNELKVGMRQLLWKQLLHAEFILHEGKESSFKSFYCLFFNSTLLNLFSFLPSVKGKKGSKT